MEEVRGEVKGKPYEGLVYSALNDKNKKVGNPFKSSLLGKSDGLDALEKRLEKSAEIIKDKGLKKRSNKVITSAMQSCCSEGEFRANDTGRIYGATFIDHERKAVFNGSRLGKEFSANVFNDLFNGKQPERKEYQPKNDMGQTFENKQGNDSVAGGLFTLLSPESNGVNPEEEEAFARPTRKKKRRKIQ